MPERDVDVVVAGAGHNSLVAAAYLARAGLSCLVLEGQPQIGGNTTTEEATLPGFRHDTCATAHNLIQNSPTLRDDELGLMARGLKYLAPDPVVHMPFLDGTSITMWHDPARTAAEFGKFSRADARAYLELLADYADLAPVFNADAYTPIGFGPSLAERLAARPDGNIWARWIAMSAWEVIRDRFESEPVRCFLLWMSMMTMVPPDQPMSGRNAFALIAGRQRNSWAIPEGGSIALPQALARVITEHGGVILTGKWVTSLIVEDGVCVGVRCADGSSYRARRAVLSTIHIKHLLDMAPEAEWDPAFRMGLESWQTGVCMFAAHYATTEPPVFQTEDGPIQAAAIGLMPSIERGLRIGYDVARGALCLDEPPLLVICSSIADPTRAPSGRHTLKVVGFHPYAIPGGADRWDVVKEDVAAANLAWLRRFAPNITEDKLLARFVKSPRDLERTNPHNWQGSCHGGAQNPAQSGAMRPVPGWAQHRMPIKGLYQVGATTHPGGSVSAGPGRNAAWVMLEDLGIGAAALQPGWRLDG